MSIAIVVVDFQKDFFDKDFADQAQAKEIQGMLTHNINRLIDQARPNQIPMIFVVSSYLPDKSNWTLRMKDRNYPVCITGTEGEAIIPALDKREQDFVVTKNRYSAFYRTGLEEILQSHSVHSLVVCGINTHACVRTTAVDAFMRDYRVFVPVECVSSYDKEQHESTLHYLSNRIAMVLSLDDMLDRLRNGKYDFTFK